MKFKLKRLCTQCSYFLPQKKTCRINPKYCVGGHKTACNFWEYKHHISGEFYCLYYRARVTSVQCEDCEIRCIRSESRREIDYAEDTKNEQN